MFPKCYYSTVYIIDSKITSLELARAAKKTSRLVQSKGCRQKRKHNRFFITERLVSYPLIIHPWCVYLINVSKTFFIFFVGKQIDLNISNAFDFAKSYMQLSSSLDLMWERKTSETKLDLISPEDLVRLIFSRKSFVELNSMTPLQLTNKSSERLNLMGTRGGKKIYLKKTYFGKH